MMRQIGDNTQNSFEEYRGRYKSEYTLWKTSKRSMSNTTLYVVVGVVVATITAIVNYIIIGG